MTRLALVSALVLSVLAACSGDGVAIGHRGRPTGQAGEAREATCASRPAPSSRGPTSPRRFTCDGRDISPPLAIHDIPEGTACLALIMDDPDAPGGTWDHWVAYDIPVGRHDPGGRPVTGHRRAQLVGHDRLRRPLPAARRRIATFFSGLRPRTASWACRPEPDEARSCEAMAGHVLAEARLMGRYAERGPRRSTPPTARPGRACRSGIGSPIRRAGRHGQHDAVGQQERHDAGRPRSRAQGPAAALSVPAMRPWTVAARKASEREVVELAPALLADALAHVEADEARHGEAEGELADARPRGAGTGPLKGTTTSSGLKGTLRSSMSTAAWTSARARPIDGEVLVQRERHRAVRDAVEELGREQEPVDDRPGQGQVGQQGRDARHVPGQPSCSSGASRHGIDGRAARGRDDDGDGGQEERPAQQARPGVAVPGTSGQPLQRAQAWR